MADLNPRGDERGQLVLVGAVVLAVTFIGLAIVVNSAIFSENLATRGDVPGSGEALDYRYEVEQGIGEIVETVNANESRDPTLIENSVENISAQGGLQQARSGRVVSISYVDDEDGNRLAQDTPDVLSANNTKTLATSVSKTRNVQLNFTRNITDGTGSFELIAQESSGSSFWNMTVDPSTSGDNTLRVELNNTAGVTRSGTCEFGSDTPSVDVTGATIDGERCQALVRNGTGEPLWFAADIQGSSDYEIRFENGDEFNGTYSMTMNEGISDFDPNALDNDDNVVYSVTVDLSYSTSAVRYETEIEVAPGEVPP